MADERGADVSCRDGGILNLHGETLPRLTCRDTVQ